MRKEAAKAQALAFAISLFMGNTPQASLPSPSRLDAQIALRLRAEGYSRADVAKAVRQCAQESNGGEKRDWNRYAERTVAYAFGVAGDVELEKMPGMDQISLLFDTPHLPTESVMQESGREALRLRMR
jgi:hypothetical protein